MGDQLGQLLIMEVPKAVWRPSLERLLQRFTPAGLVLSELPAAAAVAEVAQETARVLGSTPFLGIEDEGGGPLSNLFTPLPRADHQHLDEVGRAGDLIGRAMAVLGLNLNFAPALDLPELSVRGDTSKTGSGKKGDSSRPDLSPVGIAHRGEVFLQGLVRHHVLACARHFPGLPASLRESPPDLPVIAKPMAALWREDLVPYQVLRNEVPLIQVSHAAYKAYDYEFLRPASLSPAVVEGLLRVKLEYRGVALANISAASQAGRIEAGEASVQALSAGCDLLLVSGDESTLEGVKNSLARALDSGRLRPERVEQALARVKTAKKSLLPLRKQPSEQDLTPLQRAFKEFSGS
jgi:beta-N-acetylhexosaminidase